MKVIIKILIFSFFIFNLSLADKNTTEQQIEKNLKKLEKVIGTSFKAISGKGLNKKSTEKFFAEYVLILEDEREVTLSVNTNVTIAREIVINNHTLPLDTRVILPVNTSVILQDKTVLYTVYN